MQAIYVIPKFYSHRHQVTARRLLNHNHAESWTKSLQGSLTLESIRCCLNRVGTEVQREIIAQIMAKYLHDPIDAVSQIGMRLTGNGTYTSVI